MGRNSNWTLFREIKVCLSSFVTLILASLHALTPKTSILLYPYTHRFMQISSRNPKLIIMLIGDEAYLQEQKASKIKNNRVHTKGGLSNRMVKN